MTDTRDSSVEDERTAAVLDRAAAENVDPATVPGNIGAALSPVQLDRVQRAEHQAVMDAVDAARQHVYRPEPITADDIPVNSPLLREAGDDDRERLAADANRIAGLVGDKVDPGLDMTATADAPVPDTVAGTAERSEAEGNLDPAEGTTPDEEPDEGDGLDELNKAELQARAADAGIDTHGTKDELKARLRSQ